MHKPSVVLSTGKKLVSKPFLSTTNGARTAYRIGEDGGGATAKATKVPAVPRSMPALKDAPVKDNSFSKGVKFDLLTSALCV